MTCHMQFIMLFYLGKKIPYQVGCDNDKEMSSILVIPRQVMIRELKEIKFTFQFIWYGIRLKYQHAIDVFQLKTFKI